MSDDPSDRRAGDDALADRADDRRGERFIEGVWAIFGHGNVAGIGEALHGIGDALPTWRGQNEQTMAHAAIAYAKTKRRRRRAMAVTSSIGPGATNMVTAAALAHVNRLPVLFICGDVFANRAPGPGPAADRGLRRRHRLGQRLLPPGDPLLRPHLPPRAHPDRAAPRDAHDDRPGRLRPGLPRLLPGRAGRGLRLPRELLRPARLAHPPPRARSVELAEAVAAIRAGEERR